MMFWFIPVVIIGGFMIGTLIYRFSKIAFKRDAPVVLSNGCSRKRNDRVLLNIPQFSQEKEENDSHNFCPNCGVRITTEESTKYCPNCGNSLM